MANQQNNEGTDFSNFMKGSQPTATQSTLKPSPIQEYQTAIRFTKRMKYLVAILGVLALVQVTLIVINNRAKNTSLPEGYRLVTPANQPAYIEKIK